jgi:hypothetical protein
MRRRKAFIRDAQTPHTAKRQARRIREILGKIMSSGRLIKAAGYNKKVNARWRMKETYTKKSAAGSVGAC